MPSVAGATLDPQGHQVVSILVSCAPYILERGWTDEDRQVLGEAVLGELERKPQAPAYASSPAKF